MQKIVLGAVFAVGLAGAAAACPDYRQSGERYDLTGQQMYNSVYVDVVAGGDNFIGNCYNVIPLTDRGNGYFTTPPDFTLNISGMGAYQLVVSVVSACDSALLINTASGNWYYDDDDNGNYDPKIVLTRPSDGWLDIWVGTYDGKYCDARLTLETFKR